jgi:hypothetical protein
VKNLSYLFFLNLIGLSPIAIAGNRFVLDGNQIAVIDSETEITVKSTIPLNEELPEDAIPLGRVPEDGYILFRGEKDEIHIYPEKNRKIVKDTQEQIVAVFTDFSRSFEPIEGVFFLTLIIKGDGFGEVLTPFNKYVKPQCSIPTSDSGCQEEYPIEGWIKQLASRSSPREDNNCLFSCEAIAVIAVSDAYSEITNLDCGQVEKKLGEEVHNATCTVTFEPKKLQSNLSTAVLRGAVSPITETNMSISGFIDVGEYQVGKSADILVLARLSEMGTFYMRHGANQIVVWNGSIDGLLPFKTDKLARNNRVEIYNGPPLPKGLWYIHFGYRLNETITFNVEPMVVKIP